MELQNEHTSQEPLTTNALMYDSATVAQCMQGSVAYEHEGLGMKRGIGASISTIV